MTPWSLPLLSPLSPPKPLDLSQGILRLAGTHLKVVGASQIPRQVPLIIVSNHRSPLDAPTLMTALGRDIAFACHHYMAHVPLLRDVVAHLGAFPLKTPHSFFRQGYRHLRQQQAIGVFPEGAQSMVTLHPPRFVHGFHRGFAHLALRMPVSPLALLPVALVSDEQGFESPIPLKVLGWFDPSEPLFQQTGGHPLVWYRQVEVRIGTPIWISPSDRHCYRGRRGTDAADQLAQICWQAVHGLLNQ